MSEVLLTQLMALRAQLDAAIALAAETMPEAGGPPGCPHPVERQRDASTFGEPQQIVCLDCLWKRPGQIA